MIIRHQAHEAAPAKAAGVGRGSELQCDGAVPTRAHHLGTRTAVRSWWKVGKTALPNDMLMLAKAALFLAARSSGKFGKSALLNNVLMLAKGRTVSRRLKIPHLSLFQFDVSLSHSA